MDSLTIDFQALWSAKKTPEADLNALRDKIDMFNRLQRQRATGTFVQLIFSIAFVGFLLYQYAPHQITSFLGVAFMCLAMVLWMWTIRKDVNNNAVTDLTQSSSNFLKQLIQVKQRQRFTQSLILNLYFLFMSVGLFLYLFEFLNRMPMVWAAFTLIVTGAFLLYIWLYLRPRQIKRNTDRLDALIEMCQRTQDL